MAWHDDVDVEVLRERVEIYVAGVLDAVVHVDAAAMSAALPAMEIAIPVPELA